MIGLIHPTTKVKSQDPQNFDASNMAVLLLFRARPGRFSSETMARNIHISSGFSHLN